jgi:hypothetical protein
LRTLGSDASRFSCERDCVSGDDSVAFYVPLLEHPLYSDFWIDENAIGAVRLPPLIYARKRKALLAPTKTFASMIPDSTGLAIQDWIEREIV